MLAMLPGWMPDAMSAALQRALMKRMIAAGRLGRKSGRGFYDYTN